MVPYLSYLCSSEPSSSSRLWWSAMTYLAVEKRKVPLVCLTNHLLRWILPCFIRYWCTRRPSRRVQWCFNWAVVGTCALLFVILTDLVVILLLIVRRNFFERCCGLAASLERCVARLGPSSLIWLAWILHPSCGRLDRHCRFHNFRKAVSHNLHKSKSACMAWQYGYVRPCYILRTMPRRNLMTTTTSPSPTQSGWWLAVTRF